MTDTNGWPDAARRGVPLHPERDGWHWVLWSNGSPEPMFWTPHGPEKRGQCWLFDDDWMGPAWVGSQARYLGPCHTPVEVAALVAAAQEAMREKMRAEEQQLARIIVAADLMQQATALGPDWAATMQNGLDRMGLSDALARVPAEAKRAGMEAALVIATAVHDQAASCAREPDLIPNIRREYLAQARGAEDVMDAIRAAAKEIKP
jgi:hypothetical protein